jgi:hypothetical protein
MEDKNKRDCFINFHQNLLGKKNFLGNFWGQLGQNLGHFLVDFPGFKIFSELH